MNRIVQNVLIIDSAMGNNFVLTSANQALNLRKFNVSAIAFHTADTSGALTITGVDTANDLLFRYSQANLALTSNPKWFEFGSPQTFENIKVPILTQGTAFIYLA